MPQRRFDSLLLVSGYGLPVPDCLDASDHGAVSKL